MRFFNLVAILALGTVSAEVSDAVAPNLRGSEPEVDENRDLAVYAGGASASYSKSTSFSFNCCYKGDYCMDMHAYCWEYAHTNADTYASGNSFAEADFFAASICGAFADAHACSFACVKAKGKIDLDAKADSKFGKQLSLSLKLTQATMTVAKASSEASAFAIAGAAGLVYTETDADFCNGLGHGTPQCGGADAEAIAEASAIAFGDAYAMADATGASGTSSQISAWVDARGQNVKYVSAYVTTVAKSWSFAAASTTAFANAYAAVCADAEVMTKQCNKYYQQYCGGGTGACRWKDQSEACSAAVAHASGYGFAYADACASASAAAYADTKVVMNFGGSLSCFDNDSQKLKLEFPNGKGSASGSAACICPRKK